MTSFLGIFWGEPERLWLLPVFALAIFFLIKNFFSAKKTIATLTHETHQKQLLRNFSSRKKLVKTVMSCGALFFIFIALLQPQWHKKNLVIQQEGRDLLILLDISRSMLAQDLKPNRLDFIKLKIKSLLRKLEFERVGLILFSGSAFVQCPLTKDYRTFSMFLDQVQVENIASGTTAIDAALHKAIATYAASNKQKSDRKNKLTLLVTDGEDFSLNLETIKKQAKTAGIKIFAFGVGTPTGAPIPKAGGGYEIDQSGGIALSKLNEPLLKSITSSFDGKYIRSTYDDSDLDYFVSLLEKFEKEKFGDKSISLYQDQYPWFLGSAWFLLALAWIL